MKRKWILLLVLGVVVTYSVYRYMYQDHRNIEIEQPEFLLSAIDLGEEFVKDYSLSGKKYLNKTIEVAGNVSEFNNNNLTLGGIIFCQFNGDIEKNINIGDNIKIKGRVICYDELLEQVKLDQCSITDQ